jgi:hypothetical protein
MTDTRNDGVGDFDFFVGSWQARNRRLTKPLADCDEWDEFGATGEWSLYWSNSKDGLLGLPPVTGHFTGGVGQFYCEEIWNGIPITTRYTWSGITPESARWDQAFSTDGRKTWETNWIADFTRRH